MPKSPGILEPWLPVSALGKNNLIWNRDSLYAPLHPSLSLSPLKWMKTWIHRRSLRYVWDQISYMYACVLSRFSCVWLFATLCTVACQAPLSMGFSRQEYWQPGSLPLALINSKTCDIPKQLAPDQTRSKRQTKTKDKIKIKCYFSCILYPDSSVFISLPLLTTISFTCKKYNYIRAESNQSSQVKKHKKSVQNHLSTCSLV